MENIKLVLLDLDGTLLDGKSKVPTNFSFVVDSLAKKGIRIGIASGRNYASLKFLFPDTFNKMVAITCNGSNIYVDGKEVFVKYLKHEKTKKIIKISKTLNNATYQLLTSEGMVCEEGDPYKDMFNKHGYKARWSKNIEEDLDDILMVTVHCNNYPNGFTDKYVLIKDEINFSASWHNCIDFMPYGISKGAGTKVVCDYLNIDLNEVMAIGDQDNDLEILKAVGLPVAMLNGNINVKKIAKEITEKDNLENGAVEYLINKFVLV